MPAKQLQTLAEEIPVPVELIERRIYFIRGHKVMVDADLADLYQVLTKNLNLAVRRNQNRFPEDFMFQLIQRRDGSFEVANCNLKLR